MRIAKLKLAAAVVAASGLVVLAGVGTGYALTRPGPPVALALAPETTVTAAAADEPKPEEWTPKKSGGVKEGVVPSAFPDLKIADPRKDKEYLKTLVKLCPLLLGDNPPAVVPADDTYRRLLKARLHQGRLYHQILIQDVLPNGDWSPLYLSETLWCQNEMRSAALELWMSEPKVLIPWLEEFVIMSKQFENFISIRTEIGSNPPQSLHLVRQHRLEVEAVLWKAKNVQRPGGK